MKTLSVIFFAVAIFLFAKSAEGATTGNRSAEPESEGIKPYLKNLWYWEYKGKPILLRGGTDNDNLYQWTGKRLSKENTKDPQERNRKGNEIKRRLF